MIPNSAVHACLNCGCIYHDHSRENQFHCPVCGKGLSFAQDVEGIHY